MGHPDTPVSAIMTSNPITVGPDDTLEQAIAILRQHPFRHLPVVQDGSLVGILSDRDLLLATGETVGPTATSPSPTPRHVRDVMHAEVLTATPDTALGVAAAVLHRERIGALPIVAGRSMLGIVTETDLLVAFRNWCRRSREAPWAKTRVSDHMSRDPITIDYDAPLADALHLCMESRIRHLPVLKDAALFGILSDRDIRRGMARAMIEEARDPSVRHNTTAKVSDFTTRGVMVISPHSALTAAVFTMATNKIGALPVLDGPTLVGVISQTDILACYAAHLPDRG